MVESLKDHPEATEPVLDAVYQNLYGPGFVYCVDRAFVSTCATPCPELRPRSPGRNSSLEIVCSASWLLLRPRGKGTAIHPTPWD